MKTIILILLSLIIVSNNNVLFSQEQRKDTLLTSTFIADSVTCVNYELEVIYTGNASDSAKFNWKFNNAQVISGSGRGPYLVKWSESGIKKIELFVEEDSILSDTTILNVYVLDKVDAPEICLVTYDHSLDKNLIVWERTIDHYIDHYNIYRESPSNSMYDKIGEVLVESLSLFVDYTSDPNFQSERYKISAVDLCGAESDLSNFHATIYLTLSKGNPEGFVLSWTPYIGFDFEKYYIYRGKSAYNLILIDSTTKTTLSYLDNVNEEVFYQISVKKEDRCIPSSFKKTGADPYGQSVSNIEDNSLLIKQSINNEIINNIKIYPVPSSDFLNIELDYSASQSIEISILSSLGNEVYYNYFNLESNTINYQIDLKSNKLSDGLYILKLNIGENAIYKKILIK